jgi:hypothetical protein
MKRLLVIALHGDLARIAATRDGIFEGAADHHGEVGHESRTIFANIGYDKIEEYTKIKRPRIETAISLSRSTGASTRSVVARSDLKSLYL